jgi:hypothetical protein
MTEEGTVDAIDRGTSVVMTDETDATNGGETIGAEDRLHLPVRRRAWVRELEI